MFSAKLSLFLVVMTILNFTNYSSGNESPGFFVKVAKNVPRIGRRSGDFFLKSSKNVPRIGRRSSDDDKFDDDDYDNNTPKWFKQLILASKRNPSGTLIKSYNNIQPFDSFNVYDVLSSDRNNGNDLNSFKFVSWKDFDIALEKDDVLYKKLIELSHDKDLEKLLNTNKNWMHIDNFVPLESNDVNNVNYHDGDDSFYYRTDRAVSHEDHGEKALNYLDPFAMESVDKTENNDLFNRGDRSIISYLSPSDRDERLKELLRRSHRSVPNDADRLKELMLRAHRSPKMETATKTLIPI